MLLRQQASEIVRATSTDPVGPYKYNETILGVFAHGPSVRATLDGYTMMHLGCGVPYVPAFDDCKDGITPNGHGSAGFKGNLSACECSTALVVCICIAHAHSVLHATVFPMHRYRIQRLRHDCLVSLRPVVTVHTSASDHRVGSGPREKEPLLQPNGTTSPARWDVSNCVPRIL